MEIFHLSIFGIVATMIIMMLKIHKPEFATQASIAAGVIMFILILDRLLVAINMIWTYCAKLNVEMEYMTTLLKIIGITYIVEFGAEICKDAGESSIASKIELAGRVIIVILALPIISSMLELIVKIIM